MTKKTNPIGFRLYLNKSWTSEWFTLDKKEFFTNLFSDDLIRKEVNDFYKNVAISSLKITRIDDKVSVKITTDNTLYLTGKNNSILKRFNQKISKLEKNPIEVKIEQSDFITSRYISSVIANVIEKGKFPWKLIIRKLVNRLMEQKPLGYKIMLNGRLNNANKHKSFKVVYGKISSNTISNPIDYFCKVAVSKVGTISIKTWINYASIS